MTDQQALRATEALQTYRKDLEARTDARASRTAFEAAVGPIRGTEAGDALWGIKVEFEAAEAREAFAEFAKIADRFNEVGSAFDLGKQMVEQGQKSLFFPAAAAQLSRAADIVKALKDAADQLKAVDIQQLGTDFKKGDVKGLLGQADQISTSLLQLQQKLVALQGGLPN